MATRWPTDPTAMGWVFSFLSSQECKDCTRSRKCSDYSSRVARRLFIASLLPPLPPPPRRCFLPKGKMRKSVRTAERTGAVKGTFLLLRARNATRLLDKRPNSLSSRPDDGLCILSLDRNPLKCCAARPRGQPILIKVVGLRRSLPRPKLPPPHPLKKSPARPSTPPDALSLAKRASHTLDVRPRAGGRSPRC